MSFMDQLHDLAREAMKSAYAPYSEFKVGAVLVTTSGSIYMGCNIENRTFTPTVCAERVAIFKAISEGENSFTSITIVCEDTVPATPCGVCLQVLAEFVDPTFKIITYTQDGSHKEYELQDLLGSPFKPEKSIGKEP